MRVATPALAPEHSADASVRTGGQTHYLLNDHLTSTAITTNSSGVRQTELR